MLERSWPSTKTAALTLRISDSQGMEPLLKNSTRKCTNCDLATADVFWLERAIPWPSKPCKTTRAKSTKNETSPTPFSIVVRCSFAHHRDCVQAQSLDGGCVAIKPWLLPLDRGTHLAHGNCLAEPVNIMLDRNISVVALF